MQQILNKIVCEIDNTNVYDVIAPTQLNFTPLLSKSHKNNIYLKREDTTNVHSFKIRGAYQKISNLKKDEIINGVITASAGNHAQGVAFSANKLGVKSVIVMPLNTPKIKVDAVQNFGGEVILHGDVYDDAYIFAKQLASSKKLTFIHPYDDYSVIAGQGTIAQELVNDLENIDIIFVPVGGGGLLSGILAFIKSKYKNIKVVAVEPEDIPTLNLAIQQNSRVELSDVGRFADGVAVRQIGKLTFDIAKNLVDTTLLVNNDEICAAIKDIYNDTRAITEPSGALAVAGIKKYLTQNHLKNKNLVAIVSGGNMNFDRLRYIAERAEIGEKTEIIFAATIKEVPGSFLNFCKLLDNYNITEFNYRFSSPKQAHIFVGVDISSKSKEILFDNLQEFTITDLSDNSIAKTHIRYMVGGRAKVDNEVLYRFEFPEKPGALRNFLIEISGKWNISLFHYRNHGAAYGSVLVGFQAQNILELESVLANIGYTFYNETNNQVYKFFL